MAWPLFCAAVSLLVALSEAPQATPTDKKKRSVYVLDLFIIVLLFI
jgi:hypothetical protein